MNNINHILIQQYLDGKLDPAARHELEKQALNDPFLSDALEGYQNASHSSGYQLSLLQKQLEERIAIKQKDKNRFYFTWQRISIAAVGTMLFVTSGILFWMNSQKNTKSAAVATHKQVEVNLNQQLATQSDASQSKPESLAQNKRVAKIDPPKKTEEGTISSAKQRIAAVTQTDSSTSEISLAKSSPKARVMVRSEKMSARILTPSATPAVGWETYRDYLKKNTRFPSDGINGDVIISFTINSDGKPENLQLVKGLTETQNQEAFRLVKEGPVWKEHTDRAEVVINFSR